HVEPAIVIVLGAVLEREDRISSACRRAAEDERERMRLVVAEPLAALAGVKGGARVRALPAFGHELSEAARAPVSRRLRDLHLEPGGLAFLRQPLRSAVVSGAGLHSMKSRERAHKFEGALARDLLSQLLEQRPEHAQRAAGTVTRAARVAPL